MAKKKKAKKIKPLKVIERIIDESEVEGFDLIKYFKIQDLKKKDRLKFVYENWGQLEFNHEFTRRLFGEHYPTGNLEEWVWCEKCNKMVVHKERAEQDINMDDFKYCPKCGERAEYRAQKVMFDDVYIHRMRDTVAMLQRDDRLQYIWDMLNLKEESENIAQNLNQRIKENKEKYNV